MADVGSVTNSLSGMMPRLKGFGLSSVGVVAWAIVGLVTVIVCGILAYFITRRMKFNKKIIIFEQINGRWQVTKKDKAMEMKYGEAGDTIFYLARHKKYLPNPSMQSGKREYWYCIRSDGEWINFELKDLDKEAKLMGANFLDKEMRYARTQIQKGLKERYDQPSFWKQYGTLVIGIMYITIVFIFIWLLFDKWLDLAGATNAGVVTAGEVMEKIGEVLGAMDNLCVGGSGYVSAT